MSDQESANKIEEINPGKNNPNMTPGHNNAVYAYVEDSGGNQLEISSLQLFSFWDQAQGKYKYGLNIKTGGKSNPHSTPDQTLEMKAPKPTNNFYWRGGVEWNKPLCKTGIGVSDGGNGVLVFFDLNDPNLPNQ